MASPHVIRPDAAWGIELEQIDCKRGGERFCDRRDPEDRLRLATGRAQHDLAADREPGRERWHVPRARGCLDLARKRRIHGDPLLYWRTRPRPSRVFLRGELRPG